MPDREKAIRILEGNYKNFVLHHNGELLTVNELIALLKAQEPRVMVDAELIEKIRKAPIVLKPAVDAVPVGWLIDRANDPERAPLYRRYAQMLYEEWGQEQEART